MWLKESTYTQQSLLAQYTRSGDESIIPKLQHIKEKGIRYYRQLIFNIVWDGISNAYPILTDFLGEEKMKTLVHDFFTQHPCQTFQVWEMPKEFKDYIIQNNHSVCSEHPFIPDLLLFEWMEIELFMMPDEPLPSFTKQGNILKDKLVLNPEIQILFLQYPVHLLHPEKIEPQHKGEYFVSVHRHPESKEVLYTELTAAAAKIIEHLFEQNLSINELQQLFPNPSLQLKEQIKQFIRTSMNNGLLLGFEQKSS